MAKLVITVIGDDRSGLVDALSGVIAEHGGNWDRSHMAELAGKFAGIVLVTVDDQNTEALIADLEPLETTGLLHITAERAMDQQPVEGGNRLQLSLVGQDHPGIVHEVSHVIATFGASIEELETETADAPMGGHIFKAEAVIHLPAKLAADDLHDAIEAVATDLMVDLVPYGLE
ncbi:MAG: amino acid-binding ACT protein [Acidimicrobiia bacterium]|nr:amino acid-binding ACT protein [Acidimicrobiia bacterium]